MERPPEMVSVKDKRQRQIKVQIERQTKRQPKALSSLTPLPQIQKEKELSNMGRLLETVKKSYCCEMYEQRQKTKDKRQRQIKDKK